MRILLADNDPDFLNTRAEFVENAGYRVLKAYTLEQARQLLADTHTHLAILDIRMVDDDDEKDISGLILAKDPAYRPIPKIMLTGFPSYQYVREALGPALDGLSAAVDFLSKMEGPEAMIQAVKQAFARHVRINWHLNIRWGQQDELMPPYLVSLISPGLPRGRLSDRAGELEDLLRKLFYEYGQVTLGRVLTRREGWILLTAFAYPTRGPEEQFVVACGQRVKIQMEKEHHRQFVPHKVGDRAASLTKSAETIHFGVAMYRLSGCPVEEVTTFTDFYHQRPTDRVLTAVEDLFRATLHPWYEKEREKQQQPMETFCREWLGPDEKVLARAELEKRVTGICQAALAAGIKGLDCSPHRLTLRRSEGLDFSYPNPAPYLYEERVAISPPTLCGITHGRLDGASVLVDRTGQTWVVDFGRTGVAPLVRDFVSLETSIKFDVLRGADVAERHELERRLLAMRHLGEEIDTKGMRPEVEKAFRIIGQIRTQAADVAGPKIEPYLVGLLFCVTERFLGYQPELKYLNEETVAFTHVLLSMSMICQRLVAWEDHLQDLPPQAADSLWIDVDNHEVWVEGRQVTLTPQGFRLLKYLHDHANQLCKRSAIAKHVFDMDFSDLHPVQKKRMEKDTINSAIRRLREDTEPNPSHPKYIRTVRGIGYKLVLREILSDDRT
jgi:DNA-binding response OmpR family regulator